jgi:hypothetical protein
MANVIDFNEAFQNAMDCEREHENICPCCAVEQKNLLNR